jgi:hypothetical protein
MIHYFALDSDILPLILDYMEENRPGYLMGILMPNNQGRSALDITIENESPKNTELLLLKLLNFPDQKLSHLFYDKFAVLFKMNIKAFNLYLNTCFFQTSQMKFIKQLQFSSKLDPLMLPYHTAIIDQTFVDRF